MDPEMASTQPAKWLALPVIATIARLLCREMTLQNEYLRLENKVLRSKIAGRIPLTDDERRLPLYLRTHLSNCFLGRKSLSCEKTVCPVCIGRSFQWIDESILAKI